MQMYSEILKSRLFFILVLIMSAGLIRPVFASEEPSITTVRIDEIRFEVSGKTRPEALAREIKLETGSEYSTIDEFQTHLNREVQDVTADVIIVSEGTSSDDRGWENVLNCLQSRGYLDSLSFTGSFLRWIYHSIHYGRR